MKKVLIIGGGASGMAAALSAASDRENSVTLLERQQRVGKKLLATGNGRCNLLNTSSFEGKYHGKDPSFAESTLKEYPPERILNEFEKLGLLTVEEYGGRVYPLSDSANSVVDILRFACSGAGVDMRTSCCAESVKRSGKGFSVKAGDEEFYADALIIACGGAAGAKLGGVKYGYELLCSLGHSKTAILPALVQITTESEYPKALKGVRADARLELECSGKIAAEARGEIQFTEKGVSGPVAFDVSRSVAAAGDAPKKLHIDLLADLTREKIFAILKNKTERYPELEASELFTGILHNRLGRMMVKYSGISLNAALGELTQADLKKAAGAVKRFTIEVKGTEGFDNAQVTAGGIKTSEFNSKTLESRLVPGLYACGEVLDIDGDCGGYNLRWAWASGAVAGRLGK